MELHELTRRSPPCRAVTADRPTVLAHGLGGSTDLPIPFTYALIGAAWALTVSFVVVAFAWRTPRLDPDRPGRSCRLGDAVRRRADHAVCCRRSPVWCSRCGWRSRRSSARRTPRIRCPACSTCCCGSDWWRCRWCSARCGGCSRRCARCTGCSARTVAAHAIRTALGYWPAALGLFAFVWLELASPGSGIACRGADLAAGLRRGHTGRRLRVRDALVRARRPVRGVQHGGVAAVAAAAQRRRPDRDRQSVRPPAVDAGAAGTVAVLAVLLGSTAFDSFSAMPRWRSFVDEMPVRPRRRHAHATRAGLLVFVGVVAATFWVAAQGDRRRRPRAAPRAAGADGAFADPDRHRLRLRPLPDLSGRARTADRHPAVRPATPR